MGSGSAVVGALGGARSRAPVHGFRGRRGNGAQRRVLADPGVFGALAGRRAVSGGLPVYRGQRRSLGRLGPRGLRAIVPDGFGVLAGPVRPGPDHDRAARPRTPPGRRQGGRPRRGDPSGGGRAGGPGRRPAGLGRSKSRDDRPCPCHGVGADRHRPARAGRAGTRRDASPGGTGLADLVLALALGASPRRLDLRLPPLQGQRGIGGASGAAGA